MNDSDSKQTPLAPAGERTLTIQNAPPRSEEQKEIHQRRPLPLVPGSSDDGAAEPSGCERE